MYGHEVLKQSQMILWVINGLFIMSSLLTLKNNLSSQRFTCKYHTCRCTRWHAGAQTVCKLNPQWQTCTCTPPQQHTSLFVLPDMSASHHSGELNRSKATIHSHFSVHRITNQHLQYVQYRWHSVFIISNKELKSFSSCINPQEFC